MYTYGFGDWALGLPVTSKVNIGEGTAFSMDNEKPCFKVFILTDDGLSLSTILPNLQREALTQLAKKVASEVDLGGRIYEYRLAKNVWNRIAVHQGLRS